MSHRWSHMDPSRLSVSMYFKSIHGLECRQGIDDTNLTTANSTTVSNSIFVKPSSVLYDVHLSLPERRQLNIHPASTRLGAATRFPASGEHLHPSTRVRRVLEAYDAQY
ncbi:hypothetical protein MSAN_00877400 [Mycena sanguinolenta]|uniref:Uncharacterized protein n=1 Tax=Mycena sanguinolenta TaxID=230812 RepID=A0A8H7DCR4_9AGAR|nr:hypothetical protein MSAN_00877400 [Mycena sanguinolenta]